MKYLWLCLLLCSCASVHYKTASGEEATYRRFGPQKLDNVVLTLSDGSKLGFERQEADITAAVEAVTELIKELK